MEKIFPGFGALSRKMQRRVGGTLVIVVVGLSLLIAVVAVVGAGPACGGGYPDRFCKKSLDTIVDNWGMYNRECVSYTAYRVAVSGRKMPFGFGDANQWPTAARAHGIPVDAIPRAGDVAIRPGGSHGHSMYVESVNSNGTINVSEYNTNKLGTYSEETIGTEGLQFIHFF